MLLFQLLSRRYEHASTILTSNKGFEDWGEISGMTSWRPPRRPPRPPLPHRQHPGQQLPPPPAPRPPAASVPTYHRWAADPARPCSPRP
ncbi:MAG: ATP-binding protein [Gemmatimonadetes bacterium]|nr:ATP-binding protein [Gemmatimonadota bacterium]